MDSDLLTSGMGCYTSSQLLSLSPVESIHTHCSSCTSDLFEMRHWPFNFPLSTPSVTPWPTRENPPPCGKQSPPGSGPASLYLPCRLSPHHPPPHKLIRNLRTSVCPWLLFLRALSSSLFSKWCGCPLPSFPLISWSYLFPYACSLLYYSYLFGCVTPIRLWPS